MHQGTVKLALAAIATLLVVVNAGAATPRPKPVASEYAEGGACERSGDLATSNEAVVLSCKDHKWTADGAIWGSQWSHDPMFLLQQALGDGTRSGRQCETTTLALTRGADGLQLIVASLGRDSESAAARTLDASGVHVYLAAAAAIGVANAHGVLVTQSALQNAAAGTDYKVAVESICADRVSVSSR